MFKKGKMNSNPLCNKLAYLPVYVLIQFFTARKSLVFAAFIIIGLDAYISHNSYLKRLC